MDEDNQFNLFSSAGKEEEKQFFFEDDDEEKISFTGYRRHIEGDLDMLRDQDEDCSDCDKECKSHIMAELPTNDSNSYLYDPQEEEHEATKYLTRLGLLERVNNNEMFEVSDFDEEITLKVHDDFEICSKNSDFLNSQNFDKNGGLLFMDLDHHMELKHLPRKERELIEEGLPALEVDEEAQDHQEGSSTDFDLQNPRSTDGESGEIVINNNDDDEEEMIDTLVRKDNSRKNMFNYEPRPSPVTLVRKLSTPEKEEMITTHTKNPQKEANNLLERKTFRMMRKYYKSTFESFAKPFQYKKKVKVMTGEEMDQLVLNYLQIEMDCLLGLLAANELLQMVMCLKRIILSDRYNKNERVTKGMDFTTTRNLFNRYSSKALYDFISIPANSILFVHFYLKEGKSLSFNQNDVDKQKLYEQMLCLIKVAFTYLPPNFHAMYSDKNCQIIQLIT